MYAAQHAGECTGEMEAIADGIQKVGTERSRGVYSKLWDLIQCDVFRIMLLAEMWKEDFPDLVFTNPWGSHISDTAINQDIMKRIEELIRSSGRTFEHIYPHVLPDTKAKELKKPEGLYGNSAENT